MLLDPRASPTKLNDPIVPADGEVLDFQISPGGEWVVYRADQIYEDWPMGFRVPIGGPTGSAEPIWGLAPLDPRTDTLAPPTPAQTQSDTPANPLQSPSGGGGVPPRGGDGAARNPPVNPPGTAPPITPSPRDPPARIPRRTATGRGRLARHAYHPHHLG